MIINDAKIEHILIFLVLQQLEWCILSPLIVDIDAKEGKYEVGKGRNYQRGSKARFLTKKRRI